MKTTNECIDFIIETTKDVPHSGSNLTNHLLGVHSLMLQTNAPEYLCLAGLFHSIYGTEYFHYDKPINRKFVRDYIGKEAEELVFLFCHLTDRDETILKSENKDLIYLGLINLVETYYADRSDKDVFDMMNRFKDAYQSF